MPGAYLHAGGLHTYVEQHGAGEPLLLLHGGFENADMLPALTNALAERYRVIAPERRAHGRTPDVPGPLTYDLMTADTLAVMDALAIERAQLVGYSDGAIIGMLLASAHPERVRGLVLASGNFEPEGMTRQFVLGLRRATPERFEPRLREAYQRLSPDGPGHYPEVFAKLRRLWLEEPHIPRERLAAIAAPTLVLAGDRDFVRVEHSVELFRAIPGARLCIVPGGSHGLLTEQPDLCNRVVLDFLGATGER